MQLKKTGKEIDYKISLYIRYRFISKLLTNNTLEWFVQNEISHVYSKLLHRPFGSGKKFNAMVQNKIISEKAATICVP
jgi:hypothetical protein